MPNRGGKPVQLSRGTSLIFRQYDKILLNLPKNNHLLMQADNLSRLQFRIKNTNNKVCPSKEEQEEAKKSDIHHTEGTTCKPRCVEINLNNSVSSNLKGIG